MARVDVSKKYQFIVREGLRADNMPAVFIYFEGEYYLYEGNRETSEEMLHILNKLINPILTLETDEEIQAFLNLEAEP